MKDKVVIITGGSSGIGKACAYEFATHGSKVIITGRNKEKLDLTISEFALKKVYIDGIVADVSIKEDNQKVVKHAISKFGKIDILINNAGISMRALFSDTDLKVIQQVMDINFYGTVYASQACLSEIIKNKGSIIGISSIAGYRGLPARTGYSASKFAMQGFLEALRTELINTGVHILVACPGFTASNIRQNALTADGTSQSESPLEESKIMSAEEVAKEIYKATVKRKRDLILTTQGKLTVFLNKLFPSLMDKIVYNHFKKETNSPIK
ncbi:MAG: SDR family oxidoreductase [Cytophagales bacterium]|nr:MAG: SDR family oxidoreductase [Cytophagales bacterium]